MDGFHVGKEKLLTAFMVAVRVGHEEGGTHGESTFRGHSFVLNKYDRNC